MMAQIVLLLFCAALVGCVALDLSVLYALTAGLGLFLWYGRRQGHSWKALEEMAFSGVKSVKNILLAFVLIGMLTALWRAAGTISTIICYTAGLIRPDLMVLLVFLLNCLVSFLTGTSFGTSATMGVICMSVATAMGVPPFWVGGAVLGGAFFGDRCSPVSTSALLVSTLTGTDLYDNIRRMARTAVVPFAASCLIYWLAGRPYAAGQAGVDVQGMFRNAFAVHPACLLPAAAVLLLACCRVDVKRTMAASIAVAFGVALLVQKQSPAALLAFMWSGYRASVPELAAIMNGGGVTSMIRAGAIVCIASSYSGLFQGTGLLDFLQDIVIKIGSRFSPFAAVAATAVPSCAIACNQTLAIMLTKQLCRVCEPDDTAMALDLEDSAVVMAALVPWSIAGAVPLAAIGAPISCMGAACFLYLLPLWRLVSSRKPALSKTE